MSESDTSRTDAAAFSPGTGNQWEDVVDADFARQLERELAEALKERDAAFAMFKCECGTDEACRNLAALHSNLASVKARLDTSDAMLREEWAAHQDTKANLAEARRDAARYRWMRDKSNTARRSDPMVCLYPLDDQKLIDGKELDAAIDAARLGDGNG